MRRHQRQDRRGQNRNPGKLTTPRLRRAVFPLGKRQQKSLQAPLGLQAFFVVFLFLFCLCQTPAGYENLGTRSTAMVTKRDPTEMAPPSRNWASVWRLRRRLDQQTTEKVSSPQGKTPPPRK